MGGEGDEMTKICVTFYFPFDYDVSGITSYLSLLTDDGAYHIPRVSPLLSASGYFFFFGLDIRQSFVPTGELSTHAPGFVLV